MRNYWSLPAMFLLACSTFNICIAQQTSEHTVNVGTVARVSGGSSPSEIKRSQEFLEVLDLQLAAHMSKLSEVSYLDREHLDEVFTELHLSSYRSFDESTGALRGMLGRLDFLIIAQSSSPTLARMRILDVETGAVKATAVCQAKSSLFGGFSNSDADCVSELTQRLIPMAKGRLQLKRERAAKAEATVQAARARRDREQAEAEREEKEIERQRAAQAEIDAQVRLAAIQQGQIETQRREEQAAAAEQQRAEIDAELEHLRPTYDDTMARLSAAVDFWNEIAQSAGTLRPEISSVLRAAEGSANRCQARFNASDPEGATTCIRDLTAKLNRLDQLK